ncbi:ferredoxin [Micromonospora sp. NPDC048830]|uniref:ferredoxin n=1 Tax=Micromonospora sp. NPDC048830 TaxID=3364257 RepID=UPI0037120B03
MKIHLDVEECLGYANCVMEAPELFDLDARTNKAVVLNDAPGQEQRESAERAVRVCPAAALRIAEA